VRGRRGHHDAEAADRPAGHHAASHWRAPTQVARCARAGGGGAEVEAEGGGRSNTAHGLLQLAKANEHGEGDLARGSRSPDGRREGEESGGWMDRMGRQCRRRWLFIARDERVRLEVKVRWRRQHAVGCCSDRIKVMSFVGKAFGLRASNGKVSATQLHRLGYVDASDATTQNTLMQIGYCISNAETWRN
jgi:hypothetical protein